jgi:hypothetical protein
MTEEPLASLTITVFTRHSVNCPRQNDPQWKRCKCRKSLYIREGGKTRYISAKTRFWAEAERVARAEQDKRDPVKIALCKFQQDARRKQSRSGMPWTNGTRA